MYGSIKPKQQLSDRSQKTTGLCDDNV